MIKFDSTPPQVTKNFKKTAAKKGYDRDIRADFVSDSKAEYKKTAKSNNIITTGIVASTLIAIGAKAKKFNISLKKAALSQFTPLRREMKKSEKELSKIIENSVRTKKSNLVQSFTAGCKADLGLLKGIYKSIPKPARVVGTALLALSTINYHANRKGVEAKYDAVQYIKDHADNA